MPTENLRSTPTKLTARMSSPRSDTDGAPAPAPPPASVWAQRSVAAPPAAAAPAPSEDGVYFFGAPGTAFPSRRDDARAGTSSDPLAHEGEIVIENACGAPAPAPPPPAVAGLQRPPPKTLCSFFLEGRCIHGERCRYRHLLPNPLAVSAFETLLRDIMAADEATVAAGGAGPVAAGSAGDAASKAAAEADFQKGSRWWQGLGCTPRRSGGAGEEGEDEEEEGMSAAYAAVTAALVADKVVADEDEADAALQVAERLVSTDATCSVCLDRVLEEPGRKFGLLTSCSHCFCLNCIREWRGSSDLPVETTRACPVCRTLSYYVIPSDRLITDPSRKRQLNAEYLAAQKSIACKHWNYGSGTCHFGSSCHYKHLNPDGSEAVAPRKRARWADSGVCEALVDSDLADFLALARGRVMVVRVPPGTMSALFGMAGHRRRRW